ncbi:hypothetical protein BDM02DRAFT_861735 [Thelephora ganbajun]|uniref:Uncharacterized protein n=1 Tax=Thelephora ganbajun TaxID=370292 RepID=A0ACB6ZPK3_THEGA|nr:hypothetical protein BDM02DRAFT_861735 [Thelephora ganbajun]
MHGFSAFTHGHSTPLSPPSCLPPTPSSALCLPSHFLPLTTVCPCTCVSLQVVWIAFQPDLAQQFSPFIGPVSIFLYLHPLALGTRTRTRNNGFVIILSPSPFVVLLRNVGSVML